MQIVLLLTRWLGPPPVLVADGPDGLLVPQLEVGGHPVVGGARLGRVRGVESDGAGATWWAGNPARRKSN